MKSTLFKETAPKRQVKLPLLPPVIVGADTITRENGQTVARFSGTDRDELGSIFLEDHHGFAADIHLIFERGCKRLFFLRAERLHEAELAIEITVEADAEVMFVFQTKDLAGASARLNISANVEKNGRFDLAGVHVGEGEFFADVSVEMREEESRSSLALIDVLKGHGRSDLRIENIASAPHTKGNIVVRNILFGNSASRVQGIPVITKAARDSANHLDQSALILSADAKINAYPLLSVANNSVQATHKSSTARLLPEDRFYLNSRGLSARDAEKLMLDGFLSEVLREIRSESIRNCTSECVHHFLEDVR